MTITSRNLHEVTEQQVFDHVATHLLSQNAVSAQPTIDPDFNFDSLSPSELKTCLYRSPNGLMCAAGSLIHPEDYRAMFEGASWYPVAVSLQALNHVDTIADLQDIHDDHEPSQWRRELEQYAESRGLVMVQVP